MTSLGSLEAPSAKTYLVEGAKISFGVLADLAIHLPPPTSSLVSLVQRIIDAIEVRYIANVRASIPLVTYSFVFRLSKPIGKTATHCEVNFFDYFPSSSW